MKPSQLLLIILILLLIGCQSGPDFINHSRPQLWVNFEPFMDAGCPPSTFGRNVCQPESPLTEFGCYEIEEPSNLLGALDPAYPIAICVTAPLHEFDAPYDTLEQLRRDGLYIYETSGLSPRFYSYIVHDGTTFQHLQTKADFQNTFAPIETPEEALGYALALTNRDAYYDLALDKELEYFVDEIEDTNVKINEDGYLVHLFGYQEFGCGPHHTYTIDSQVSTAGELSDLERTDIFKNPSEDGMCVD